MGWSYEADDDDDVDTISASGFADVGMGGSLTFRRVLCHR